MKIETYYSDVAREWQALDADTYDAEFIKGTWSSGCPLGIGKTKEEAINDLVKQMQERGIDLG